jgi:F0F1-type ATP synthase alpha subunit
VEKVIHFETEFHRFIKTTHPEIRMAVVGKREITADIEEMLKQAIAEFKQTYTMS